MKKFTSLLLIVMFLSFPGCESFAGNKIRVNAEVVDGYQYKTVLKHYQPYSIGIVNEKFSGSAVDQEKNIYNVTTIKKKEYNKNVKKSGKAKNEEKL